MNPVDDRGGFSLIEVLVAVVILATGLLMLAGGSLVITRDLTRARKATVAAAQANAKLDELRNAAASTTPTCTSASFVGSSSAVVSNGVTMSWTVPASGAARTLSVITTFPVLNGRTVTDTLLGMVAC